MPVIGKRLSDGQFVAAMKDGRLPMKARGMLATLQTMDEGETFSVEEMAEGVKDGYTTLLGVLRTLERVGYLERRRVYNSKGVIDHSEYILRAAGK